MILTGQHIHQAWRAGEIWIDPFDPGRLNPNSYNFRLGARLGLYTDEVLDARHPPQMEEMTIGAQGFVLRAGELYLGHTVEVMGSDHYVPMIFARSSIARLGLFIQITAPLGDLGYRGQWTLQLCAQRDLRVYPQMSIGQILFLEPRGDVALYAGKYQQARGPQASQAWRAAAWGQEDVEEDR